MANFPNGEMPRVATATPKPYIARLYVTQDFGFGDARDAVESDENQLGGSRPATRYSITVGRFTVTDFFDNNRYTHDPRTQFMGWAIMYNGAWDYPADTRGYTWGWVHEFHTRRWSVRYASAAEPRVANGLRFDRRLFRDRGDNFEGEVDYKPHGHAGAVRAAELLQPHRFRHLRRGAAPGRAKPARTPDVTATRQPGTLKYGFGISADQEIAKDIGVFARLGWNDGKTESFAFTAIDRLAEGGVSVAGARWRRPDDVVATGADRQRAFGGARAIPGARRAGLPDRRRRAALRHEDASARPITAPACSAGFSPPWICSTSPTPPTIATAARCGSATLRLHMEYGKKVIFIAETRRSGERKTKLALRFVFSAPPLLRVSAMKALCGG